MKTYLFNGLPLHITRLVFFVLFFVQSVYSAGGKTDLTGFVMDVETSKPVENAVIQILQTEFYATSREDGSFHFSAVSERKIHLKITHLSYQEKLVLIDLESDKNQNLVIYLLPRTINLSPVIVTGEIKPTLFDEMSEVSNVLKGKELQRDLGLTLAATLRNETGLAIRSMGPAPARPVIRGLGQNRVLITEDGISTSDLSATSPDHAVTLEPFTVERIEVIRGPKVLLYTPTTLGGVVNTVRREIPDEIHNQIHTSAGGYVESANKGYLGAVTTEIPFNPFAIKMELTKRNTSNLTTPVGELNNSYSDNLNYSIGTSLVKNWGYTGISFRNFELDYGVPGGFVGAHPNGVDIEIFRRQLNLKSQIITDNDFIKSLETNYSYSLYRHKEFEDNGRIGSEFKIQTHLASMNLNHNSIRFITSGTVGVSFEFREYEVGGFVFNPPSNSFNMSFFLFETFSFNRFHFEFGSRYNFDKINPLTEEPDAKIGNIRDRKFNTYSLSASTLYELSDIVFVGINLSKSSRVPTIEELFSEGPHLAAYSYEIGNPDLNAETGFGSEFFIYHKFENLFFNMNIFYNRLNNYILPRNTGEINFATFLPVYATTGAEAEFYGIENQLEWSLNSYFTITNSFSFTRGILRNGESLPQIPPAKGKIEIRYNSNNIIVGLGTEWAAKQDKVDKFEEPTAGYMILNNFYQYNFQSGELIHSVALSIDNILNKEYRNHLSRVKSILPEAGRNFRLSYRIFI